MEKKIDKPGFTPEQWVSFDKGHNVHQVQTERGGIIIGEIHGKEQAAFVTACPDMYEALEAIIAQVNEYSETTDEQFNPYLSEILNLATAALNKAKGI